MFIPYRTDAPLYHWPYATVGSILACAALSIAAWQGLVDGESLALQYDRFLPHQWVTSLFLHGGVAHLVGNAIFLWVFGMIVEGKIGWWRFLAVFLAIGVVEGAVEHVLFSRGASLGASGVIFGLMGIAMIWAPENEVEIAWVLLLRFGTFEAKVRTVAICYALWQLLSLGAIAMIRGFGATSELLHLMGFAIGLPLGVEMLRAGLVDCEGWDWFSVRRGDHRRGVLGGFGRAEDVRRAALRAATASPAEPERELRTLRIAVADADVAAAAAAASRIRRPLERVDLLSLADLLYASRRFGEAAVLLSEARLRFPDVPARVALRRAEIAIRHEARPGAALELLRSISREALTVSEQRQHDALLLEAQRDAADTPLELCGDPL